MSKIVEITGNIVMSDKCHEWCLLPYPNHPKGCPNYGKKVGCPPDVPYLFDAMDMSRPAYFAYIKFDLKTHAEKLLIKHPEWTSRQSRCCLYWQGGVRRDLREFCNETCEGTSMAYSTCPEAMGMNVMRTATKNGIPIDIKAREFVYKIALVGFPTGYPEIWNA